VDGDNNPGSPGAFAVASGAGKAYVVWVKNTALRAAPLP
jgi:hypothetical protein